MKFWLKSKAVQGSLSASGAGLIPLLMLIVEAASQISKGQPVDPAADPMIAIAGAVVAIAGGILGVIGRKNASEDIRFK